MNQIPIVAFKLATGEVGIGRLNEEKKKIEKILFININMNEKFVPRPQVMFFPPLAPLSNEFPSISLDHVLFYSKVTDDKIRNLYMQATTGLTIPESKNIGKIIDINEFVKKWICTY